MVLESLCAIFIPIVAKFICQLMQRRREKLRWKTQVAHEMQQAEQKQERKQAEKELERKQAEQKQERKQAEKEKERQQAEQKQERKLAEKERERKQAEQKQERKQAEKERTREAKQEQEKKQAEKERARESEQERERFTEWRKTVTEELEKERKENDEKRDKEFQNLQQNVKKQLDEVNKIKNDVKHGIQMFFHFLRQLRQQSSSHGHHCRCPQCRNRINVQKSEYHSYAHLIEEFGNDEEELHTIFNESLLLIQDKPGHSSDGASSSHSSIYPKELALLELPEQIPESFENDILSLVMTTINGETLPKEEDNVSFEYKTYNKAKPLGGAAQAREEGNAYFKDQKFDEAIKCYAKSIDQSPTAAAYANRAIAYIKLEKFIEAENDCTEALNIDGCYFKAYARRAIARSKRGRNLYGALDDVDEALKLESGNEDMKALRSELHKLLS